MLRETKITRAVRALIAAAGLQLVELSMKNGHHYRAEVRRQDGATKLFFFAGSPSDYRAEMNNRALLRRFAEARDNVTT